MKMLDGLINLVSGLGTARDKGAMASYTLPTMTPYDAFAAYKASSLIRRVVDLPAEDACREWREWQAEATDISAVEAEESRLGIQGKVMDARRQARLFGCAALLIGDGAADTEKPLNPEAIRKGGLRYVTPLSRDDLSAGDLDRDPESASFGKPNFWRLTSGQGRMLTIHPSRLVLFHGIAPMAGLYYDDGLGWGDSVLLGMLETIRRVDEGAANVLSLVYEAKIDVIKIPDLMSNLQSRGAEYEDEVLRRLTLAATGKGINGTLMLDALEDHQQKSASFGGLPDVLDRFMQLASAASGIPMTLLFGMSPGGLNASGDVDVRGYYDRVRVQQTLYMQPAMAILDECLIRSALGDRPDDLHYTWRPLWQPTAKERADIGKISAETMKIALEMDAVSVEAAGAALVNVLTESGAFPGLEGYAADFPLEDDDFGRPEVISRIGSEEGTE